MASRPFRTQSGVLVEDLTLSFVGGKVVEHDASHGQQAFEQHLATDRGARYLGEFALVGEDSPLAQSGFYFDRILFDENACSHVALGLGFVQGLPGGEALSTAELERLGCNRSATHSDIPFGAPAATVVARRSTEGEVVLLEDGSWSPRFTL